MTKLKTPTFSINQFDSNKKEQQEIIANILDSLGVRKEDEDYLEKYDAVKESGIDSLTEYGRVVHAEMEALLMCARNNISTRNAILYATTFPCHNCAKHIIAAGIRGVVYIEPYPKSKAFEFHKCEIIGDDSGGEAIRSQVLFTPFYGVGPRRFTDLFAMSSLLWKKKKRKGADGNRIKWKQGEAEMVTPMNLFTYITLEALLTTSFENILEEFL